LGGFNVEVKTRAGRKVHMWFFQEAYDAECAAIARALAVAAGRTKRHKLGKVRIFTDAQAARGVEEATTRR